MYEVKPQTLAEGKTGDAKIMAVTRTLSTHLEKTQPYLFIVGTAYLNSLN